MEGLRDEFGRKRDKGRSKNEEQRATCARDRWLLSIGQINQWRHAGDTLFPGREGILIFFSQGRFSPPLFVQVRRNGEKEGYVPGTCPTKGMSSRDNRNGKRVLWKKRHWLSFSQPRMRHFTRFENSNSKKYLNWDFVSLCTFQRMLNKRHVAFKNNLLHFSSIW